MSEKHPHPEYLVPDLPSRIGPGDLDGILRHLEEAGGFDDIYLCTDSAPKIRAHGDIFPITNRILSAAEVDDTINAMFGANATTELGIAKYIDFSHELTKKGGSRFDRYRYRVNATAIRGRTSGNGINITMRSINSTPWQIETMGVEPEVLDAFDQNQGMVLVTGTTGSGKSTLLSAVVRRVLESREQPRVVLTYEAPIEYVYDKVDMGYSIVCQSEVPTHVRTFSDGVVSAMRRNPDVILVGESRDRATISAASEAAMTGHLVLSTVHSNTVAETLRRMVVQFDPGEHDARLVDMVSTMRMIVTQRLEKTLDGGRKALREFLVFTPEIREAIYRGGAKEITPTITKLVDQYGKSMKQSAQEAFDDNLIGKDALRRLQA